MDNSRLDKIALITKLWPWLFLAALLAFSSLAFADTGKVADPRTQVYALSEVDRPPQLMVMARLIYPPELKAEAIAGEVRVGRRRARLRRMHRLQA